MSCKVIDDKDVDPDGLELICIEKELTLIERNIEELLKKQNELVAKREIIRRKIRHKESIPSAYQNWESNNFLWSSNLKQTLKSVFHIDELRPYQLPTINAILSKQDCILIMPTGGGKSLCYQLPALINEGVTLVVSPLISLMEDQIMALQSLGVKAEMLSSNIPTSQQNATLKAMVNKTSPLKILYVTPERLKKSKRFMSNLEKMFEMGRFSLLAVDEVHCCSQWGHDFRPDYKILGIMKQQFPSVPILGLTATATTTVTQDVQKIMNTENCLVFRASFNRPNLVYKVVTKSGSQKSTLNDIAHLVSGIYKNQSGIIYCLSIKEAEEVAEGLVQKGIKASPYHANLEPAYRSQVHKQWIADKCQVVVATIAFGMGIDKSNVRFIIHHTLSKSIENYYQESGRAGRDGKPADCVLFFRFADVFRNSAMAFQDKNGVSNVYNVLAYCIEKKKCRRAILASYFGERWDSSDCNKKCDNCNVLLAEAGSATRQLQSLDVTEYLTTLLQIIEKASLTKQRLTALKLLDSWLQKSNKNTGTAPNLPRTECERIVAHLLIEGYLKEEFHFTAYNTVSYINKGPQAFTMLHGQSKIVVDVIPETSNRTKWAVGEKVENPNKDKWLSKEKPVPCTTKNRDVEHSLPVVAGKRETERDTIGFADSDSELDFGESSTPKIKPKIEDAADIENIDWDDNVFSNGNSSDDNRLNETVVAAPCRSTDNSNDRVFVKRKALNKNDPNVVAKRLKL